jgi:mannitol-1-/sugar-/sorbitol-6-phosphatase
LSDLDGTLIDSKASVVRAFEWWADLRHLPPGVAERLPHGRTSTAAAAELAPHLDAAVEGAILDERQRVDTEGVVALRGARGLLESHPRLAVVTSCPIPLARARLAAAGLPLPAMLVTPELTKRGKPDPEPYLLGAELLGAAVTECVVLEDAPVGVASGRAAGMIVIGVLTTHNREDLGGATACIADLTELADALDAIGIN